MNQFKGLNYKVSVLARKINRLMHAHFDIVESMNKAGFQTNRECDKGIRMYDDIDKLRQKYIGYTVYDNVSYDDYENTYLKMYNKYSEK